MRVLFLHRNTGRDIVAYAETLAEALDEHGVEAVVDDASEYMPAATVGSINKKVTKELKVAAKGFDLVHAFGYRAAWACGEAFYIKRPWVYTAFDMPRTTHVQLIDRLNMARRGICVSGRIQDALGDADALHLEVQAPCAPPLLLEAKTQGSVILAIDDDEYAEQASLTIEHAGFSPHRLPGEPSPRALQDALVDALLLVVRRWRAGFSIAAAQAMRAGIPVMLDRGAGLGDMGVDGHSAFLFSEPEGLVERLNHALEAEISRESVANAGRVRAVERFDPADCARRHARLYKDLFS